MYLSKKTPPPQTLSRILSLAVSGDSSWADHEYGQLLSHQLDAPLHIAIGDRFVSLHSDIAELQARAGDVPVTVRHVLTGAEYPARILQGIKDFAKHAAKAGGSGIPTEVARVIYYAVIAKSVVTVGESASALSTQDVHDALRWVRNLEWIDPDLRDLADKALSRLSGSADSNG